MTDNQGWIQLHRTLQDNPIWGCEPFTKGQAWVDLLILANHKDGYILIDGQRIDIKRGQLGWSVLNLSKRWKWSRGKTTRYLKMLSNDSQIELKTNTRNTIITICNYDKYQSRDTTDSAPRSTTHGHHVVQHTDTNNNDNNDNNDNNIEDLPKWLPIDDWVAFKEMRQEIKKPMSQLAESRMIKKLDRLRNDGYDPSRLLDRSIINKWQDVFEDDSCKVKGEFSGMFG